jgi:glycine cleavage system T protein (aminomethyltransferase)
MTTTDAGATLKRTPLHDIHVELGAKMVPFAGYEMPVQYPTGITAEHKAVRERAGLFDVSHMGEFVVRGKDAVKFVNYVTTNDVGALAIGQAHYSSILNDRGTFEDDCLVYRFDDHLMMVVNASNVAKDLAHISRHLDRFDARIEDVSDDIALLALQGPQAARILQPLTSVPLSSIKYYHFAVGVVADVPDVIVSRTGYTGEDGFELYFDPKHAATVWNGLVESGRPQELELIGLGARDTLRLEMGYMLYGNDIDDTTTPFEAGLGFIVKLDKEAPFTGQPRLKRQKLEGIQRRLVGFRVTEPKVVARHGFPVSLDGKPVDIVRSGTVTPTANAAIGTTYLPTARAKAGTTFTIDVRGRPAPAEVVKLPFVPHRTKR